MRSGDSWLEESVVNCLCAKIERREMRLFICDVLLPSRVRKARSDVKVNVTSECQLKFAQTVDEYWEVNCHAGLVRTDESKDGWRKVSFLLGGANGAGACMR